MLSVLSTPSAEGDLGRTPLAHVLVHIWKKRLDGTLVLGERTADEVRLGFQSGELVRVHLPDGVHEVEGWFDAEQGAYAFYDGVMVGLEAGYLSTEGSLSLVLSALRAGHGHQSVGPVLDVRRGERWRLSADARLDGLGPRGEEEAVVDLLRAEPSSFDDLVSMGCSPEVAERVLYVLIIAGFVVLFDGRGQRRRRPPTPVPLDQVISHAVSKRRTSSPSGQPPPVSSRPPPAGQVSGAFSSSWPAAGRISSGYPAGTASEQPNKPEPAVNIPGKLPASLLEGDPLGPVPEVPADLADKDRRDWLTLADMWPRVDQMNFYQMLGVKPPSDGGEIKEAYFALAKRWHPDRVSEALSPIKPWIERWFQLLSEAHAVLSDKRVRQDYLRSVESGGGTLASQREVESIVSAAKEFQHAEIAIKQRRWHDALTFVKKAQDLHPEEADYHATEAYVYLLRDRNDSLDFDLLHRLLDRALELDDQSERAMHYKALALKRQGLQDEAFRYFKRVADMNPRHLEAVREVRLAVMRRRNSSKPPPSLWERLFGREK